MTAVATPDAARLVFAAVAGLILLLILIIKFKVHAMISILVGAVGIGLMAGMPLSDIVGSVNEGIGNTLKGIALLVGLGSMFGAILEESGGAQTLAVTMVRKFGDEKAAWALGITGLVVAMPVFFDAGLIILIPLAFSLAKRTKRSVLYYVIPLLAGLAVGHAFIPPTPGPVLVATMLGVDLGWVILIGIFCGIFAMIAAGPIWGSICGRKYRIEVPEHVAQQDDIDESKLPKFGTIVGIILIPLVLIIANSVAKVVPALAGIQPVLAFLGEPFMALLLATIAAMYLLGTRHGYSNAQLEKIMTKSLEPTGMILLVTACGGVLRYMLQNSGLGDVIGNAVANASLPLVLVAFIVAALVRISVGSSTVAMTMAAGIISAMPGIRELSPLYLACVTAAIAGGSIQVTDPAGQVVFHGRTDETGECKVLAGKAGTYRIVEIEPANGYERSEAPWQFLVSYDGTIAGETTLYNEKIDKRVGIGRIYAHYESTNGSSGSYGLGVPDWLKQPKAGDTTDSFKWYVLATIFAMGAGGLVLIGRRKGKKKDDEA